MIEIALYRGNSFVSRLIRFFSRDIYSHAAIRVDDAVFEAKEFKGVIKSTDWNIKNEEVDIFLLKQEISNEKLQDLKNFLDKQVGKPYDYLMVLGFILYTSREGRKNSGKWFCSELIFAALEKIGIKLLNYLQPWKVHPSMICYSNLITFSHTIKK